DLVTVLVEKLDTVLTRRQPLAILDLVKRGHGQAVEHDEPTDTEGQSFGGRFVEQPLEPGQPETREEARQRVIAALDPFPRLSQSGIDPCIDTQPVDDPIPAALLVEPVVHTELALTADALRESPDAAIWAILPSGSDRTREGE